MSLAITDLTLEPGLQGKIVLLGVGKYQQMHYGMCFLTRASAVLNCQLAFAWCLLRWTCHALTSWARICLSAMRRSRHCAASTPSSDSAISSQLPCLGV